MKKLEEVGFGDFTEHERDAFKTEFFMQAKLQLVNSRCYCSVNSNVFSADKCLINHFGPDRFDQVNAQCFLLSLQFTLKITCKLWILIRYV